MTLSSEATSHAIFVMPLGGCRPVVGSIESDNGVSVVKERLAEGLSNQSAAARDEHTPASMPMRYFPSG